MFKRFMMLLTASMLIVSTTSAQSHPVLPKPEDDVILAYSLYDQLRATEGNLFFSPYSVTIALMMAYAGARGDTATQMATVMDIQDDSIHEEVAYYIDLINTQNNAEATEFEPERIFAVANALWVAQNFTLNPDYPAMLTDFYNATITPTDFVNDPEGSRNLINDTIYEQTRERIENLIPEGVIDEATRLILTNAVYFKANWAYAFKPVDSAPFNLADGSVVDVPSMAVTESFYYVADETMTAVALPYNGWASQMVILMPNDMSAYEAQLAENRFPNLTESNPVRIALTMPKFTFESSFSLSNALKNLGMTDIFDPARADLSGMADADLFLQEALHKAFIAVDENGTEAAAATALVIGVTSMPIEQDPIVVKIDKPFLFYIQDTATQEILFMGRVMNPAG